MVNAVLKEWSLKWLKILIQLFLVSMQLRNILILILILFQIIIDYLSNLVVSLWLS